jgi:hypothetical protein
MRLAQLVESFTYCIDDVRLTLSTEIVVPVWSTGLKSAKLKSVDLGDAPAASSQVTVTNSPGLKPEVFVTSIFTLPGVEVAGEYFANTVAPAALLEATTTPSFVFPVPSALTVTPAGRIRFNPTPIIEFAAAVPCVLNFTTTWVGAWLPLPPPLPHPDRANKATVNNSSTTIVILFNFRVPRYLNNFYEMIE